MRLPSARAPDTEVQKTVRAAIRGWGPTVRLLLLMIVRPIMTGVVTALLLMLL